MSSSTHKNILLFFQVKVSFLPNFQPLSHSNQGVGGGETKQNTKGGMDPQGIPNLTNSMR